MSSLTQGRETTLEEMLDLREERAARQRQMLAESGCASLVCLSLNMAGPVKRQFLADALFEEGRRQTADVRTALGALELAWLTTAEETDPSTGRPFKRLTLETAQESVQKPLLKMDEGQFYVMRSAFI